ncbi:MAG: type II toxin-antitoxin system VapC family toxin [Bacteroidota bacterium]
MAGKLLDSNVLIDLFREDLITIEKLKSLPHIYIPVIVLGELFYGANLSKQIEKRVAQIRTFAAKVTVLNCDSVIAEMYGEIKSQLRRDGKPIPKNDIWIAALAKQYKLSILSNDKHFTYIKGVRVESLK